MSPSPTEAEAHLEEVPFADPQELLYRKFEPTDVLDDRAIASGLRFERSVSGQPPSGMSFNRSTMASPQSVLEGKKPGCRAVQVAVANVPTIGLDGFTFRPEHKPIPSNMAHSEVRAYASDGSFVGEPSVFVRKQFREDIAKHLSFAI